MKYTPKLPGEEVNVTPSSPLKEFAILSGCLSILVVVIYLALGWTVDWLAPKISPELENRIGLLSMPAWSTEAETLPEERNLQEIVERIQKECAHLPYTFRVHLIDDPEVINALAFPGGHILVFTGFLEKVTSENELSFVLGHEMGHFAHRDHLKALGRSLFFMALSATLFGSDSDVGKFLGRLLGVTEMQFTQKQETRADLFGLRTLHCLYGHVGGATDFFEKIPGEENPGRFGHYFSTHPENRRRIQTLKDRAAERKVFFGRKIPFRFKRSQPDSSPSDSSVQAK